MTAKEAWKEVDKIDKCIDDLYDLSVPMSLERFTKIMDECTTVHSIAVLGVVKACGRTRFDSCCKRLTACKYCENGSEYKRRW